MKKLRIFLLMLLFIFPSTVFALEPHGSLGIFGSIFIEAFLTFFYVLTLTHITKVIFKTNYKKILIILLIIRIVLLLFFDCFINTDIAIIDFLGVFLLVLIGLPVTEVVSSFIDKRQKESMNMNEANKCEKCGTGYVTGDAYCSNCGVKLPEPKVYVSSKEYDPIYLLSEESMLEKIIDRELEKSGFEKATKLIPKDILKRKIILKILLLILIFIYVSLIFFHFPIWTYIIGLIIIIVFNVLLNKYDVMKFLKKEVKSRPSEKISNVIMSAKESLTIDISKKVLLMGLIFAVVLPMIIFIKPRILYEKQGDGYAVRFYTFGLTNFSTAKIPETHNGKKVIALRGNTFSNMPFLKEVKLPDTITEIRGQAFKNDRNLVKVNIPKRLEYLGGGAFYNCKSIKEIILPDTLTHMGGETFYGAKSLKSVKLSKNLKEIRGDSFEYCYSLEKISIPDNVTRIGGHAFYSDGNLSEVILTENSKLNEIGSSAFRLCNNLKEITLPKNVSINERAFKESPTIIKYFGELSADELEDKYTYRHHVSFAYVNQTYNYYDYTNNINITFENSSMETTDKYNEYKHNVIITGNVNDTFTISNDNKLFIGDNYAVLLSYESGSFFSFDFFYGEK